MRDVSFRWGFVGVGQGGCRIAESFFSLGYKDCIFLNTATVDLGGVNAPESNKLVIGSEGSGAGKDPEVGESAAHESQAEILHLLTQLGECEQIFICAGAGGGTGTGATMPVFDMISSMYKDIPIGIIASMPGKGELVSDATKKNAAQLLNKCCDMADADELRPFIVIDNDLVRRNVKPKSLRTLWHDGNRAFSGLLHKLNVLSSTPTMLVSLDKADLRTLMFKPGTLYVGSRTIDNPQDEKLVRTHLDLAFKTSTMLHSDNKISESDCACVLTMPSSILDGDVQFFDLFADVVDKYLTSMPNSYIHRGIYEDEASNRIRAITLSVGEAAPRSSIRKRLR